MKKKVVTAKKTQKKVQKNAPQKYVSTERDQFTVVLENLNSQFKMVGEAVQIVSGRLDRIDKKLDDTIDTMNRGFAEVNARFDRIESRLDSIEARLAEHDTRLAQLELAIRELVKEMQNDTKQKQIDSLIMRVAKLEEMLLKK